MEAENKCTRSLQEDRKKHTRQMEQGVVTAELCIITDSVIKLFWKCVCAFLNYFDVCTESVIVTNLLTTLKKLECAHGIRI